MSDAKYLKAFNLLKPNKAIRTDEELRTLYVERPDSPLAELRDYLLDCDEPEKILFTGHMGSGKSSELSRLASEIKDRYFVLSFSAKSDLNLFDLNYLDLLLRLTLELIGLAGKEDLHLPKAVEELILSYVNEIIPGTGIESQTERKTSGELQATAGLLKAKIGIEKITRDKIRANATPKLNELFPVISAMAHGIREIKGKKILLVVEDLDKASIETSRMIFHEHATDLIQPDISIIYTFPIELRREDTFKQIKGYFNDTFVLPNIKCCNKDGRRNALGYAKLSEILTKRLPKEMIAPDALEELVEMSGGMPRDLIRMARRALTSAGSEKRDNRDQAVITKQHVESAVWAERRDFQLVLNDAKLELLRAVHVEKEIPDDPEHLELLQNMSVLEFRNREVWYDVHPVIKALLPSA